MENPEPNLPATGLWDTDNPRAIISMVPNSLRDAFQLAREKRPELFGQQERELYKTLRSENKTPTPEDSRLRTKFWFEYDEALLRNRNIRVQVVLAGTSTEEQFDQYLKHPTKVAWLLTPPADYEWVTKEALAFGIELWRDVLEQPHINEFGKIDYKLLEIKSKIILALDMRVKGGITQRIEQKTLGLNIHATQGQIEKAGSQGSMAEIDKRIKELEARERRALNLPSPHGDPKPGPEVIDAELVK